MRSGKRAASVPNCSAMTSGEWFGSMMPPEPMRIFDVAWPTWAMTTAVAALEPSRPGIQERLLWPWMPWSDYAQLKAAYYAAAFANPRPDVVGFRITVDGKTYEREGIMCLVANAAMIQGDVQIVPDCRMDDGALDVIVVEVGSVAQLAGPVLFALLDREGNKIGRPHIESFHGADIVVECSKPVPIEVDGDSQPALVTRYEAHALPGEQHPFPVKAAKAAARRVAPRQHAAPRRGAHGRRHVKIRQAHALRRHFVDHRGAVHL